ncbi:fatty acid desaturase family protein [Novipirellula rosea]|uniref:Fatty acid desaturase n=1 Tax=Novipirellula rosea TaxID=1031540 RepID=A0ABP8MSV1_9BACT
MTATRSAHSSFPVQARPIVADLFQPKPLLYWLDFSVSLLIAYGFAAIYLQSPLFSLQQWISWPIAAIALYRVASFMHEIVHFRSGEMRRFRIVWDLLAGIPMLTPSFFYESHNDHHNARHYGTHQDGEYLPLGTGPLRHIGIFLFQILLQPIFITLRFLLTPLTFLHPRLRRWTLERASSFVIDFRYRRKISAHAPLRAWAFMDLACSLRAWAIFVLCVVGINDWSRVPLLYALAALSLGLNHLRTLAAHRYLSQGHAVSHETQVFDSTNVTGVAVLTELLFPLGMRYHGLHHLFPRMPYHNLGIAHRRLMEALPSDSPYRDTVYPSWFSVVRELVYHSAQHSIATKRRRTSVLSETVS